MTNAFSHLAGTCPAWPVIVAVLTITAFLALTAVIAYQVIKREKD